MEIFLTSESAGITKSLRGAKAYVAKRRIKFEDDEHISDIKRGETFYLKKLGKRYYLLDVEKEKGKTVYYQFKIDEKEYNDFASKHTPKNPEKKPAGKKPAGKKPAGKKPAGKKPAGKKPAGKKPAGKGDEKKTPAKKPTGKKAPAKQDPKAKAADAAIDKAVKGGFDDAEDLKNFRDKLKDGGFKVDSTEKKGDKEKAVLKSPKSGKTLRITLTEKVKAFFAALFS